MSQNAAERQFFAKAKTKAVEWVHAIKKCATARGMAAPPHAATPEPPREQWKLDNE